MPFTNYCSSDTVWSATWTWPAHAHYILASQPDGTIVHSVRVFRFSQRCSSVNDSTFRRNVSPSSGPCALERRRLVSLRRREPISKRHVPADRNPLLFFFFFFFPSGTLVSAVPSSNPGKPLPAHDLCCMQTVSAEGCALPPAPCPPLAHFLCWPRMIDHVGK